MNKLSLVNVKGVTGEYSLSPITIITGRNSVGKTAILNAITLALLGYVPAIGKQASSTFNLCSSNRMVVVADGRTFAWEMKKTKVQTTVPDGFTPAPETLLDLNGLFSITKEQRMMAILRACVVPEKLSTHTLIKNIQAICPSFQMPALTDRPLEDIEALTKTGKSYLATLKARIEEFEAGSAKHAEAIAAIPSEPNNLEKEISAVSEEQGIAKQKARQADNAVNERAKIAHKASTIAIPDKEALLSEKAQLQAQIAANPSDKEDTKVEAALIKARDTASQKLEEARAQWGVVNQQVLTLASKNECPTCGHPVQDLDKEARKKELEKLKETGATLRLEFDEASKALKNWRFEVEKRRATTQTWGKRIATIDAQLATIPQLEKTRADLMDTLKNLPEPADAALHKAEVDALQVKLEALQQRQRYWLAAQSYRVAAEEAVRLRKLEEGKLDGAKLAIAEIVDFRTDLLNQVSSTLLTVANRVVEPVLGKKLEFADGDFTLGQANLLTLSGSEKMVVFAALQISLSANYSPKIVLMDELGVVDQARKAKLLDVIQELITDKTIEQFVAVDIHPLSTLPAPSTTIFMGGNDL